jgi:RNA polymerase sigma-70 factor (ECF subfamily)
MVDSALPLSTPAQDEPDDLALRARSDPAAFAALYDAYFTQVYNTVFYRVLNPSVADDLTAQTFERALKNIRKYRPQRGRFVAWLLTMARNVVRDELRKQQVRPWVGIDQVAQQPSAAPLPEQMAIFSEEQTLLLAAIADLSERERELLALKYGAGLTNREIAVLAGLSESNVGTILHRSITRLRSVLKEE